MRKVYLESLLKRVLDKSVSYGVGNLVLAQRDEDGEHANRGPAICMRVSEDNSRMFFNGDSEYGFSLTESLVEFEVVDVRVMSSSKLRELFHEHERRILDMFCQKGRVVFIEYRYSQR